jgi:hypothetical protein
MSILERVWVHRSLQRPILVTGTSFLGDLSRPGNGVYMAFVRFGFPASDELAEDTFVRRSAGEKLDQMPNSMERLV